MAEVRKRIRKAPFRTEMTYEEMQKCGRRYGKEVRLKVLEMVAMGMTDLEITKVNGLGHNTIYHWKKNDPVFAREYETAKVSLKENYLRMLHYLGSHSQSDVVRLKAITWYLERKFPEEFAPHQVIHSDGGKAPLDILLEGMGDSPTKDADPREDAPD